MKNLTCCILLLLILPFSVNAQVLKKLPRSNVKTGSEDYTTAVLWEQHSGEYRALAFQAFNFARLSLDALLLKDTVARPKCVIVDIDETMLDNSPFQGYELRKGLSYNEKDWNDWTSKGIADTVPGALSFVKYAASKGVETFYISNRMVTERDGTLKNLVDKGFPYADDAHLLLKSTTSDKEPRRQLVMSKYNVLLLCGDNLSDFSNIYYREGKNVKEQIDLAPEVFGTRFIMLPNAMYGDWEKQFYQNKKLDESGRSRERINALKTY